MRVSFCGISPQITLAPIASASSIAAAMSFPLAKASSAIKSAACWSRGSLNLGASPALDARRPAPALDLRWSARAWHSSTITAAGRTAPITPRTSCSLLSDTWAVPRR
eukprot:CAMPEP_0172621724 /NCGR_PEP_ID=MMETSP1068-20121228/114696_1 /TAXON_ID=35684 /ORGANISM="Pseudopedinella elastica, Strain CCMP716" /LENGTH=107 /DNA_ID=CAMNT_0013429595 /DNA_START=464 /DNA_END=787 /DNA_ORIENTATION=-